MLVNSAHSKKMRYRAEYVHEPGVIKDVFDGSHYRSLLNNIVPADDATHPFFYFPMNVISPLAFQPMVLLHSRSAVRRVGPSSFSTTISLPKYVFRRSIAFTLPQSQVQQSLGIGIPFVGHLSKS